MLTPDEYFNTLEIKIKKLKKKINKLSKMMKKKK